MVQLFVSHENIKHALPTVFCVYRGPSSLSPVTLFCCRSLKLRPLCALGENGTPTTLSTDTFNGHPNNTSNDTFNTHLNVQPNGTFNGQKKTLVSVAFLGGFVGYVVSQFVFLPTFLLALGGGGLLAYMGTTRK